MDFNPITFGIEVKQVNDQLARKMEAQKVFLLPSVNSNPIHINEMFFQGNNNHTFSEL